MEGQQGGGAAVFYSAVCGWASFSLCHWGSVEMPPVAALGAHRFSTVQHGPAQMQVTMGAKPHDASFQIECKLTVSLDVEGEMYLLSFQPANQMELSGEASRPGGWEPSAGQPSPQWPLNVNGERR